MRLFFFQQIVKRRILWELSNTHFLRAVRMERHTSVDDERRPESVVQQILESYEKALKLRSSSCHAMNSVSWALWQIDSFDIFWYNTSHWQQSQVCRFSDCCSADLGPCLPMNQLYNNQNIGVFETLASDRTIPKDVTIKMALLKCVSKVLGQLCDSRTSYFRGRGIHDYEGFQPGQNVSLYFQDGCRKLWLTRDGKG